MIYIIEVNLICLIIFPFVLGIIQIFYPELPTVCLGMAFPSLYVHNKIQELRISTDYLTNMNNRNQLIRYLSGMIRNESPNLYLFMMDMDEFKQINDVYGHTEGDNAIICVADRLKEVGHLFGGIVARYGGDEFSYAADPADEADIEKIKTTIAEKMKEESKAHPYMFAMSVGVAKYEKGQSIVEFISAADKKLYEDKVNRKNKRWHAG